MEPKVIEEGQNSSAHSLLPELTEFQRDCEHKHRFNARWNNAMNIFGLVLGISIVTAGVFDRSGLAAVLGAMVSAIVSAQRAFPFGTRAQFYRSLIAQVENLRSEITFGLQSVENSVQVLAVLRLDFARQFPQGSSFKATDTTP